MKPISLLFCALLGGIVFAQYDTKTQSTIDSLRLIAESDADDSVRVEAYYNWDDLIYLSDPELDFQINQKVISIADENIDRTNISFSRLKFFYKCKAKSTNILGLILTDRGDYTRAHQYFEESLEIAEALSDTSLLAGATNNLGMVYKLQGFPELSLKYYQEALKLDVNADDWGKAIYYNNVGLGYASLDKQKLALNTYRKSLLLSKKSGNIENTGNVLNNIGEIFYTNEVYDSAVYYFRETYNITESMGDTIGMAYSYERMGVANIAMGNILKAINYCDQGLDWAISKGALFHESRCHQCLYNAYKIRGNSAKALYHYERYDHLQDSILNLELLEEEVQEQYQQEYETKLLADSLAISNQQKIREVQLQADIDRGKIQKMLMFIGLAALFLIALLILRSYNRKKKDNQIIITQKAEVEEKNQEIMDSITYAERIQTAILPPDEFVKNLAPNSFIWYQPKDIVAGDFYWMEEVDNRVFLAVADCTGHGVPGAMVSVVCHNALNRSIREFKLKHPGEILDKTRELVIETFAKSKERVKDGMDISLICWNKGELKIEYAGANNSIYIVRNKNGTQELEEIKADKQPIGEYDSISPFKTHEILLDNRDIIYAFTDGFADQFGGEKGKKYKYKQLKNKCLSLANKPIPEQKKEFEKEFIDWKGDLEQLDDVCILGLSLN